MNTIIPRPISEAQRVLRMLYDYRCAQSEPPKFEQFYPVDSEQVLSLMGWNLDRVTSPGYSGIEPIEANLDFDKKVITLCVDNKVTRERINFSLAHEIGHIFLHGDKGVKILLRTRPIRQKEKSRNYRHPFEVEADRFAKELLMPNKAVKYQFTQLFNCSEITVDSEYARSIYGAHHLLRYSEAVDEWELARTVAFHTPNPDQRSLVTFFYVSNAAMAKRLLELRLVLN